MQPTIIFGTGENLGDFTVKVDQRQMMRDFGVMLRKTFGANGMWRKMLILITVVLLFGRLNARLRRKNRERRERKKARIWSDEMNKK